MTVETPTATQQEAPADYASLSFAWREMQDGGDYTMSKGSGTPCGEKCGSCGAGGAEAPPSQKALKIYETLDIQRNGNSKTCTEIVCVACGMYTIVRKWEEG